MDAMVSLLATVFQISFIVQQLARPVKEQKIPARLRRRNLLYKHSVMLPRAAVYRIP